jgi:8-oxo-dGTP diphosphatase
MCLGFCLRFGLPPTPYLVKQKHDPKTEKEYEDFVEYLDSKGFDPNAPPKFREISRVTKAVEAMKERVKYRGVSYVVRCSRWQAVISVAGVMFHIGTFHSQIEAAVAWDNTRWWTQEYSRNYPMLNFPDQEPAPPSNRTMDLRLKLRDVWAMRGLTNRDYKHHKHPEDRYYLPPRDFRTVPEMRRFPSNGDHRLCTSEGSVILSQKKKERPRLGCAGLVRRGEAVLLGKRAKEPNRGLWVLPGGGVEFGERFAETLARELQEEAGIEVEVHEVFKVYELINPPDEHRVIVYMIAEHRSGEPMASSDLTEVRFFERCELKEMSKQKLISPLVEQVLREATLV